MSAETEAVKIVAGLMALAARTAPKAVGLDSITIEIVTGKDQENIAEKMIHIAAETGMDFFRINGEQIKVSDATFLIGVSGEKSLGLNCGGCGYVSCKDMEIAGAAAKANKTDYKGPNCVFKVTDLGIAVGSAAKKVVPLAASIGVYPRTQSGPLYPLSGSSTTAMEAVSYT